MKGKQIDIRLLRKVSMAGIPSECRLEAYSVLLGIWKEPIEKKYRQYEVENFADDGFTVNKQADGKSAVRITKQTAHQIEIDMKRLSVEQKLFRGCDISPALSKILAIIAAEQPEVGYAQGMADILVPLVRLCCEMYRDGPLPDNLLEIIQPHAFYLFQSLIRMIDESLTDLFSIQLARTRKLLEFLDSELILHLDLIGLEIHMVAFRWYSCLFSRELDLEAWYRFFDAAISTDINEFIIYFGAAILLRFRRMLLTNGLAENMLFLQAICEEQLDCDCVEELIGSAMYIKGQLTANGRV